MKKSISKLALLGSVLLLTACQQAPKPSSNAYWQRIETYSALYLTGPKAQQKLDQNIARCTHEIKELVKLGALRETTPPATHNSYHSALEESGDLAQWETPTHAGQLMVDHSDYHDFESCMRAKGWERVKSVRYQADRHAKRVYQDTQDIRKYGVVGAEADQIRSEKIKHLETPYTSLNE